MKFNSETHKALKSSIAIHADEYIREALISFALSLVVTAIGAFIAVYCLICDMPELPQ